MALVPGVAAAAKAPPAGIPQRVQFENLAGSSDDTPSSPASEPAYQDALLWISSAELHTSSAQSNALPSDQQPPPQPVPGDTQRTPQPVSTAGQPAANTQPRNAWADMTEVPNAPTAQQRTGDIRRQQDEARQPQPNRGIWASRRFFNNADTEAAGPPGPRLEHPGQMEGILR